MVHENFAMMALPTVRLGLLGRSAKFFSEQTG